MEPTLLWINRERYNYREGEKQPRYVAVVTSCKVSVTKHDAMTSKAKYQIGFDSNILFTDTHQTSFLYLWTCQQFACVMIWILGTLCLDKIVGRDVLAVVPLSDVTESTM